MTTTPVTPPTEDALEAAMATLPTLMQQWDGASATVLGILGDRLGLFRALAQHGPATPGELAGLTSTTERYIEEWLAGATGAGFLTHDELTKRFALAPGMELVLGRDDTPVSFGGGFQNFGALLRVLDDVEFAFRHGGGVHQQHYGDDCYEGMARSTATWHDHLLVDTWIPRVSGLAERLAGGAHVADIGCGQGRAAVNLARAFPASTFVGFDVFEPAVDAARAAADAAGVSDRVQFEVRDAAAGLPEKFDVAFAFDVLHDAADPTTLLGAVREALTPDGVFVVLEVRCGDTIGENTASPFAPTRYVMSLLYCLTTSLARGGAGLGTCGLPASRLADMARDAGFAGAAAVVDDNPFNVLYVLPR